MKLPEYIEAYNAPTGSGEPKGILDQIRGNVTNDKIPNYVVPTSSGDFYGSNGNPIRLSDYWHGVESTGYYQVEFKDRYVFLTHYSLRSWGIEIEYHSKEWDLYGFNADEEPTLLSSDTSVGSTYCGDGDKCNHLTWGTFEIKNTPKKVYRFFRIMHPKYKWFVLSGIEFFGILLTKKSRCCKSIPLGFRVQKTLLLMILVCLS